jgi:hypothetical protein
MKDDYPDTQQRSLTNLERRPRSRKGLLDWLHIPRVVYPAISIGAQLVDRVNEMTSSIVPTGKALLWLASAGAALFMAGVGVTLSIGEYRRLPIRVDALADSVFQHSLELQRLERISQATDSRSQRILCLVELAASSTPLSPLEVNRRCP